MYKIKQTRLLVIWLFVVNTMRLFIITKILMRIIHHDANIIHAYGRGSGRTINTTCCVNDNNDIQRYSSSSTSSSLFYILTLILFVVAIDPSILQPSLTVVVQQSIQRVT